MKYRFSDPKNKNVFWKIMLPDRQLDFKSSGAGYAHGCPVPASSHSFCLTGLADTRALLIQKMLPRWLLATDR